MEPCLIRALMIGVSRLVSPNEEESEMDRSGSRRSSSRDREEVAVGGRQGQVRSASSGQAAVTLQQAPEGHGRGNGLHLQERRKDRMFF